MPAPPADAIRISVTIAAIQGLLLLSWTLYTLFLPGLAAQVGLSRTAVVWLLMVDQLLFALGDWAAGLYADRLGRTMRALGPLILATAVASAALLCALPAVTGAGSAGLLVAAALAWACSSSMLRAPVFSLLGRIGGVSNKSGVINLALVGVGLAGAMGPLLTDALRTVDARWPLLLASLALVLATLPVLGIARQPAAVPARLNGATVRAIVAVSIATLLAAFGVQLFTVLTPAQLASAHPLAKTLWAPLFWAGFSVGLLVGALTGQARSPVRWEATAFALGALAIVLAPGAQSLGLLSQALIGAGACWAVVYASGLMTALRLGRGRGLATPLGIYLSAISLAAAGRLLLSASGVATALPAAQVAALAWLAGGGCVLLCRTRLAARIGVDRLGAPPAST